MDADNCYFGRRAKEERVAAETALNPVAQCAHLELAVHCGHLGGALRANVDKADEWHPKFGVEDDALYDFRDYGLD